jgi:sensor c-di-GMP phosphodiesterase-like protein
VAGGAERPEQVAVLEQLGCATAQGYLFATRMPAAEFVAMLCEVRTAQPATNR